MSRRSVFLLAVLISLPSANTLAQVEVAPADTVQNYSAAEVVHLQNELLRQHNADLLDTVKWAVGGIFTLVTGALVLFGVIVGVNMFQYNRRYSEDKARMEAELEAVIAERLERAISKLSEEAGANRKEVLKALDDKLSSNSQRLRDAINTSARSVRSQLDQLKLDLKMKALKKYVEGDYISDSFLFWASEALGLTHTAEYGWAIQADILSLVRKSVEKLKAKNATIEPENITVLNKEMDRLEKYQEEVQDLKDMIRDYRNKGDAA